MVHKHGDSDLCEVSCACVSEGGQRQQVAAPAEFKRSLSAHGIHERGDLDLLMAMPKTRFATSSVTPLGVTNVCTALFSIFASSNT